MACAIVSLIVTDKAITCATSRPRAFSRQGYHRVRRHAISSRLSEPSLGQTILSFGLPTVRLPTEN
jgi:hypothetical protein